MAGDDENLTEAQIAVHWGEEGYIDPPSSFQVQANLTDAAIRDRYSLDKFPAYFEDFAALLDWDRRFDEVVDLSNPPGEASMASAAVDALARIAATPPSL